MNHNSIIEITNIFIAIGTVLAVIVALFKEMIMSKLKKPILIMRLLNKFPDCHKTYFTNDKGEDKSEGYYYRLWIENIGNEKALDVEVYASKLFKKGSANDQFIEVENFVPMNLLWSYTKKISINSLLPKMGKHCDFFFVLKSRRKIEFRTEFGVPIGKDLINDLSNVRDTGEYMIEVNIFTSNSKSSSKKIYINHTGDWYDSVDKMCLDWTDS